MKATPDKLHHYRVRTDDGIRYLNEQEKKVMMDAVMGRTAPDCAEDRFLAQWYPIAEMLPDLRKVVLFAWVRQPGSKHTMRTGVYTGIGGRRDFLSAGTMSTFNRNPTHWRELPKLDIPEPFI